MSHVAQIKTRTPKSAVYHNHYWIGSGFLGYMQFAELKFVGAVCNVFASRRSRKIENILCSEHEWKTEEASPQEQKTILAVDVSFSKEKNRNVQSNAAEHAAGTT